MPNRSSSSSSETPRGSRWRSSATDSGGGSAASSLARDRSRIRSSTAGSTGAVGLPKLPSTYLITWSGTTAYRSEPSTFDKACPITICGNGVTMIG